MESKINIIDSLDVLKILVFWDILKTGNKMMLDANYEKGKEYAPDQVEYANVIWESLYDDYFAKRKDGKSAIYLRELNSANVLRGKIQLLENSRDFLTTLKQNRNYIKAGDFNKLLESQKTSISKLQQGIIIPVRIEDVLLFLNRLIGSLVTKFKAAVKNVERETNDNVQNVFEVVANVGTGLNLQLNVHDMVVSEWVAYEKMYIKKTAKNGKG